MNRCPLGGGWFRLGSGRRRAGEQEEGSDRDRGDKKLHDNFLNCWLAHMRSRKVGGSPNGSSGLNLLGTGMHIEVGRIDGAEDRLCAGDFRRRTVSHHQKAVGL